MESRLSTKIQPNVLQIKRIEITADTGNAPCYCCRGTANYGINTIVTEKNDKESNRRLLLHKNDRLS
jgi:hypothetical protein